MKNFQLNFAMNIFEAFQSCAKISDQNMNIILQFLYSLK